MKNTLDIKITFNKGYEINRIKIKLELLKLWFNTEVNVLENTCLIKIKWFEARFDLNLLDIIEHILLKMNLKYIKEIDYKLDFYTDYKYFLHYILLDFNLEKEEREYIKKIVLKLIESKTFLDWEKLKELQIVEKNKNPVTIGNIRNIFDLDHKLFKMNNYILREKLIKFIIGMRGKVWIYKVI